MEITIMIMTAVLSIVVTAILGMLLIPMLKRLKFGQTIREDGPTWHKAKQGTPTMGGLMFIGGIIITTAIAYIFWIVQTGYEGVNVNVFAGILMALCFGVIGFIDDYIKVVKKRNLGLSAKQKLLMQTLVTTIYLLSLHVFSNNSTMVAIPFIGTIDFSFMYYIIMGLLIIGMVNSANLTDGVDGLLGTVTFVIAIAFIFITMDNGMFEVSILSIALAGSLIAFLVFNIHPAKVFMGDTGSFFLGGIVVALAFAIGKPLILFFVGFIYCIESLSVILQVISFKTRGKRIFKMSPIHHHFEMSGYSENKIVSMFSFITAITCILGFIGYKIIA